MTLMASRVPNPPPGFDDLSVGDQVAYVQSLWERVVDREHAVPPPAAHRQELDERVKAHRADPTGLRAWSEVQADLKAELAHRRAR